MKESTRKEFLKRFCDETAYYDDDGKIKGGMCRLVSAEEVLAFFDEYEEEDTKQEQQ